MFPYGTGSQIVGRDPRGAVSNLSFGAWQCHPIVSPRPEPDHMEGKVASQVVWRGWRYPEDKWRLVGENKHREKGEDKQDRMRNESGCLNNETQISGIAQKQASIYFPLKMVLNLLFHCCLYPIKWFYYEVVSFYRCCIDGAITRIYNFRGSAVSQSLRIQWMSPPTFQRRRHQKPEAGGRAVRGKAPLGGSPWGREDRSGRTPLLQSLEMFGGSKCILPGPRVWEKALHCLKTKMRRSRGVAEELPRACIKPSQAGWRWGEKGRCIGYKRFDRTAAISSSRCCPTGGVCFFEPQEGWY